MSEQKNPAIVCNIDAIAAEDWDRHVAVGTHVFASVQEVQTLSDGYALRLPAESAMLRDVAEYISNERLCCAFVHFTVDVEPAGGPFWLRLTGAEGAKDYMRTVILDNNLLNEQLVRAAGLR
jgi:hypothetical protein